MAASNQYVSSCILVYLAPNGAVAVAELGTMQNVKGLRLRARLEKNMSRPFI